MTFVPEVGLNLFVLRVVRHRLSFLDCLEFGQCYQIFGTASRALRNDQLADIHHCELMTKKFNRQ